MEDIKTILSMGLIITDFAVARENLAENYANDEPWYREGLVKLDNKLFQICLKMKPNESCIFLNEGEGCTLNGNRPNACKVFPFWINTKGALITQTDGIPCYIESRKISIEEGIKGISETEQDIRGYYEKIRQDSRENHEAHIALAAELIKIGSVELLAPGEQTTQKCAKTECTERIVEKS